MRVCARCDVWLSTGMLSECPVCGCLDLVERDDTRGGGFFISWGVLRCEECGKVFPVDHDDESCPGCGSAHGHLDELVDRRIREFGPDLVRVHERLEYVHNAEYGARGQRMSFDAYRDWLNTDVLEQFLDWSEALGAGMSRGDFNYPSLPATRDAWTCLLALVNEVLDFALSLKGQPGPAELIATHRTLIRGTLEFASSVLGFLTTLTAPTASVAQERGRRGQELLDRAGATIAGACKLSAPAVPGAAVAPLAGAEVAEVFVELADLASRDPVLLRPLLPLADLARRTQDSVRRADRTNAVLSALAAARSTGPDWIEQGDVFVDRCSSGWRKLIAQHERFEQVILDRRDRAGWVDDVVDIGAKLAEGPFCAYAGVVLVAAKVGAGTESVLDAGTNARHRGLSPLLKGLQEHCPMLIDGIDAVLRHASAHYDYEIRDGRTLIHHLPPRGSTAPIVDELTHDDLLTSVANLFEHSLAMAIGVLRWVWETGSIGTRERFRQEWLSA